MPAPGPDDDPSDAARGLARVREEVDALDRRIVALLAEREALVRRAGTFKRDAHAVRAPDRQREVFAARRAWAIEAGADPDVVEATYRAMVGAFVELELRSSGVTPR